MEKKTALHPRIKQAIGQSILVKQQILEDERLLMTMNKIADVCTIALKANHKLLFCGNGGSAADAQHLAAEFSGRFYLDRPPLFAEALHVNSSFLTAAANDFGFEDAYARLVQAKGQIGDILFCISTSGNSANIVKAIQQARKQQLVTVAMTGQSGGKLHSQCDFLLNIPSTDTPRIQEAHILVGHIICELVERSVFS